MRSFSRIWSGISEERLRWRIDERGKNTYDMNEGFDATGSSSRRRWTSWERWDETTGIVDGNSLEEPRMGTQTALNWNSQGEVEQKKKKLTRLKRSSLCS